MEELLISREDHSSYRHAMQIVAVDQQAIPPPLADGANRQQKDVVIQAHVQRFNH